MKKQLNTTLIYVLSIFGLLCCCFGGLGIILSAPAYFMANKKIKDAQLNPDDYEGDLKAMNTAKTVALVVTIICGITLLYNIYDLATGGYQERVEMFNEFMEGYQQGVKEAN
ncbi:CCC motif membrane protein [Hanstruepera flava]|uniref:CCC motif membrane protein n=1 Tax=Hanstruepera flava TaxID=2930218 RepID=UPI002027F53A|nr:CCC motif membrane protein [Hanstruepera flava]